jgi:hypothetical protein
MNAKNANDSKGVVVKNSGGARHAPTNWNSIAPSPPNGEVVWARRNICVHSRSFADDLLFAQTRAA